MFMGTLPVLTAPPCRRSLSRFQLAPKLRCAKIRRETKSFLVFLLPPSWKRVLCRLRNTSSTSTVTETLVSSSSCDTLVNDSVDTSSELSRRKTVRFDNEPAIFFRSSHIRTPKRSSLKLPERPCLVRRYSELSVPTSEDTASNDSTSIYEDCVCDAACSHPDASELEDRWLPQRLRPRDSLSSLLYEAGSGAVELDGLEYGYYCLTKYLDKQREAMKAPQKLVFEHPSLLPWPSRNLPPIETFERLAPPAPDPPQVVVVSPSRSHLQQLQQCIVDEFENAVTVLCIGLIIYTCIFLFFLYNVFTRGLLRSH
ncbi:hypothetical protein J3A83DRAFT_3835056 [Scleroderma citrinum]